MTDIGVSYGLALYGLAKEENLSKTILQQLDLLNVAFLQEPDFIRLLSNPCLNKQERCHILDESFGLQLHPYLLNFMKLLTEKGLIRYFTDCVKAYREKYNQDNDILTVTAVSAVSLTQQQQSRLQKKLEQITGKTVELQTRTDKHCLGGVRLDYDGKRIDGTVQSRLEGIRAKLNNTVL